MECYDLILEKLQKSKFRNSFKLKDADIKYINQKGIEVIKNHAYDFIKKRLAPAIILNDGKQTPMKGHPVFIAQHATACCCRECLFKWHKIEKDRELMPIEIDFIVGLIMERINRQIKNINNY